MLVEGSLGFECVLWWSKRRRGLVPVFGHRLVVVVDSRDGLRSSAGSGYYISVVEAYIDSKLVSEQMNGLCKVGGTMREYWLVAQRLAWEFPALQVQQILRGANVVADHLNRCAQTREKPSKLRYYTEVVIASR
ncbi:hypothetical protein Drorol1_Dr00020179 [Drosera rotundifolia]